MEEARDTKHRISGLLGPRFCRSVLTSIVAGIGMWIVAGLYHNLVLPLVDPDIQAHHEGLDIMLYAYLILASLMVHLYSTANHKGDRLVSGVVLGMIVGILWTFPHGLAIAGLHGTSILKEILNSLWHVLEQGIGGLLVALVTGKAVVSGGD